MLRRIYDWIIKLSGSRHAMPALAVVSFTESSFFPIPPDAMIIPMVLADPKRAWRIALVAVASTLVFLVALGWLLYPRLAAGAIRDKVVSRMEARLGRQVTVGSVEVDRSGHAVLRRLVPRSGICSAAKNSRWISSSGFMLLLLRQGRGAPGFRLLRLRPDFVE